MGKLKMKDGQGRSAARLDAVEGAVSSIFGSLKQLDERAQNMGILLRALGLFAGGDEALQPHIDAVLAELRGAPPAVKPEEAPADATP